MRLKQKITTFWMAAALSIGGANATLSQTASQSCHAMAGQATAEAPISQEAFNQYFNVLARARPHCEMASIGTDPDPEALFHLAVLMQREGVHEHAMSLFQRAAQAGIAPAHTKLGDYYNFGIGGIKDDTKRALAEYKAAADLGEPAAISTLAIMYQIGRGTRKDQDKMFSLLKQSADAGYHFAQVRLADNLLSAQSFSSKIRTKYNLPDPVTAITYYRMAADQGNKEAAKKIEAIYAGLDDKTDPDVKLKLLRHSAEAGDAQALNDLGFLYERGELVEYDPEKAARYYIEAIETGKFDLNKLRGRVNGRPTYWDRSTALAFQTILAERGYYMGALDALVGFGTLAAARRLGEAQN